MQKITPFLWYDKDAKQAAELYVATFGENSKITEVRTMTDTPSGTVEIVAADLLGMEFGLMSAGPYFKQTPAVSFHVKCRTPEEVDQLWGKLIEGGNALMELGTYPFSPRYGWLADKYGVSWQIIYRPDATFDQRITPVLMYVGDKAGKAEEAINFYASVFPGGKAQVLQRYGKGQEPDKEGTVTYASFTLFGIEFGAMDSAHEHKFTFSEATSFVIHCDDQKEIDYYWEKLSANPASEQCGWLKDTYGVSWQVVPRRLDELLADPDKGRRDRATQAMLQMKKIDIAALEKAADGA